MNKKKIVIIGATSAIAEHCARLWAAEFPVEFTLVSRDSTKTALIAADLRARNTDTVVNIVEVDFLDPTQIQEVADNVYQMGTVDIVLIAHGVLPEQEQCQISLDLCSEALMINGTSPVLFAEAFVGHMQKANKGTLAVIGSVAGDRGRKSNYVYGAAKSLVERYVQGLQHRLANTQVKAILIKPGPTDTPMTAHLKSQGANLASVTTVATCIVNGIARQKPVIFAPAKWKWIMLAIQHLPRFVFNKLDI